MNAFAAKEGNEFILSNVRANFGKNISSIADLLALNYSLDNLNSMLLNLEQIVADPSFNVTKKKSFGFSRDEFIIKCKFRNDDCDREKLVWEYNTNYGNCFKFNSGFDSNNNKVPIIKSYLSGNWHGFSIELFIGLTSQNVSQLLFTEQISTGAAVFITNQSYLPALTESLTFKPGVCINIALEKIFTSDLERPYSDCEKLEAHESFAYNQLQSMGYRYRKKSCRDIYLQNLTIKNCGCYNLNLPSFPVIKDKFKPCLNVTSSDCATNIFQNSLSEPGLLKNYHWECPNDCEYMSYRVSTTFDSYPSPGYAEYLKNHPVIIKHFADMNQTITFSKLKESMVCIKVNYPDLRYTYTSQYPTVTILSLSNIIL